MIIWKGENLWRDRAGDGTDGWMDGWTVLSSEKAGEKWTKPTAVASLSDRSRRRRSIQQQGEQQPKKKKKKKKKKTKKQLEINCGAGQQRDGRQRLFRYRAFDYSGYRSSSIVVVEKWRERVSTV
jgi:ribosomal protein L44E